jgi:hypothetical protein
MSERVDRIDPPSLIRLDDYYVDSCPWCGDELDDHDKCARNCNASRVNRTDER